MEEMDGQFSSSTREHKSTEFGIRCLVALGPYGSDLGPEKTVSRFDKKHMVQRQLGRTDNLKEMQMFFLRLRKQDLGHRLDFYGLS